MKRITTELLKFKKLQRRLSESKRGTVGLLELLWLATSKEAMRGDIGKFSNEDIAVLCDWEGDADLLIQSLVDTGWLDEHPQYRLVVHDWSEHSPWYVHQAVGKKEGFCVLKTKSGVPPSEETDSEELPHSNGQTPRDKARGTSRVPPRGRSPDLSRDGPRGAHTIPSHTIPSTTSTSVAGSASADPESSRVVVDENFRKEVRTQANALLKVAPTVSAEIVWKVAWVGVSLDPAIIPGIVSSFKAKRVQKHESYIMSSIRNACKERDQLWHQLQLQVEPPPERSTVREERIQPELIA